MKNLKLFTFFACAFFVVTSIGAQTNFWTLTEKPKISDESGQKVLSFVEKLPNNLGIQFAKINPIENSKQEDGSIAITLDGVEAALSFKIKQCEYTDSKDYYFFAAGDNGTLTWFSKEGGIGGELELFSQVYSIYPIGENNVVIMKRDMNFRHKGTCGNVHGDGESPKERAAPFCGLDCGSATVDILALITPTAAAWLNNNWGVYSGWFIYQETHNMNTALWSSGIGQGKNIRVRTINYTPTFPLSNNPETDKNLMNTNNDIQNIKNQHRADVVVLLTNQNYSFSGGQVFGIASTIDPTAPRKNCIVEVPFIGAARFTFAHEVAHVMGAWHRTPATIEESCAHGHRFNVAGVQRTTIMAESSNNQRIQGFSNPNVNFNGVATGIAVTTDNASIIRGSFCTVANNMPNPSFSASISSTGPMNTQTCCAVVYQPQLGNLVGMYSGIIGLPPYTYQWSLATWFTNPYIPLPSTDICVTINLLPLDFRLLRLVVTSSDGFQTSSIEVLEGGAPQPFVYDGNTGGLLDKDSKLSNKSANTISVYPNPAFTEIRLTLPIHNEVAVRDIQLVDSNGRIKKSISEINENTTIDISSEPSGIYLLKYTLEGKKIFQKIIIIK